MESFESANLLLKRAKTHICQFEVFEKRFTETNPYRQFTEKDTENGDTLFKVVLTGNMPSILPVILFDCVNCLRSSLDHAVFDSAVILGGNPRPKYTKFPFGKTAQAAAYDLPRKRSEVPESIRPFLLSFKPFDPSEGGNAALWGLNEIRNGKIHQTLMEMAMANHSVAFNDGYIGSLHIANMESIWNGEKRELTYMRATTAENIRMNIKISAFIAFDKTTGFPGEPAIGKLYELHCIIGGIVSGIEAETGRLRLASAGGHP